MNGMKRPDSKDHQKRMVSLRTKLIWFIGLIITGVCSGLSWYLVQQQAEFMRNSLINTGTIVLKNLVHNSRYNLITQDKESLTRVIEGAMSVQEVVYVVATGPDGDTLVAQTKGMLTDPQVLIRDPEQPLYPDPTLIQALFDHPSGEPTVMPYTTSSQRKTTLSNRGKGGIVSTQITFSGEQIYDFGSSVKRRSPDLSLFGPLTLESEEKIEVGDQKPKTLPLVIGGIHVGLTNAYMLRSLNTMIWNVMVITIVIIVVGIALTMMLANRIVNPLRRLARMAGEIAAGDLSVSVTPDTRDEVGQLTTSINQMTQALNQREQSISTYVQTITKQVSQLSTLNQSGIAITSTLDIERVLTAVLDLLAENLGFTRMMLVLYDQEQQTAEVSRVAGVSDDIAGLARRIRIPVRDDDSLDAEILIHGKPILVTNVETVASRIYPDLLTMIREVGVRSFVVAPLKSQRRIHGYLGADRVDVPCTQEDLDLLITVTNSVAVAIDNAQTYQALEQLNLTLEQRVQDRTQELQSANERLQELDKLKSAFVSIVSHELRTPMTSVKGLVENMLDGITGSLTERQFFYLERVRHNMDRLTRMINDLLDLSRIEAGRMELRSMPVSIADLANEVAETLSLVTREKSLSLQIHTLEHIPVIEGDRDKLHQVLTNLISNAIKFTDQGGEIRVETRMRDKANIQICVQDTGCGIPKNELKTVFERFYRGQTAPVESRGAGLGLAITRSLVELHGGRIWVESTLGQGSRFFVVLPIHPPHSGSHV